ncbi:hypothetical protein VRU48_05300 [Pedobacter sp. KR3-3]|uniref:Uncharacterized protein n=1 Tax=Pedobacter albus TaxID=3113905 RepID=A0ABU7I5H7_9SPHI|nr:hypothetical protein [Pedobacter sp. KR3-3]MEE1944514.1 hypothetical protein [Pedobacter sp. KR3-3]
MITTAFKLICSVNISHSYFEDGLCKCIHFKPGKITQSLQKRFELKMVNRLGGFDLYANILQTCDVFLAYLKQISPDAFFDFEMESLRPDFVYFTAFPMGSSGKLSYDSGKLAGEDKLLAENYSDETLAPGIVGQLKIHFDDILSKPFKSTVFTISLKAKATQWQYYVVNKSAIVLADPLISGKSNIQFTGPTAVVLATGQTALLFTSGHELLPLSEVPKYKFDLQHRPTAHHETGSSKSAPVKFVLKGLPCPDPGRFGQVKIGESQQFSSPMYVYV